MVTRDAHAIFQLASFIQPSGPLRSEPSNRRQALAQLVSSAFPAIASRLQANDTLLDACLTPHWTETFNEDTYRFQLHCEAKSLVGDPAASALRVFVARQKLRIALREVLPPALGGASLQVCARELSDLASVAIQFALNLALNEVQERFSHPTKGGGQPCSFCVIGMGKLGGQELNAGSDIDLICFYDTDHTDKNEITSHEFWTRVVRRMVPLLEEVTVDGMVWRVDLRLRPEGTRGPLVNSLSAMLNYYETWGRLWERAAWTRARPVAGDRDLGQALLEQLQPFVYRRAVDPTIADSMCALVEQARAEGGDTTGDLKLGKGGIRDLETFVQSLQLIWAGKTPALRVRPTLKALDRLRTHGYVTEREAVDLGEAYTMLRAVEHLVQNASGLQTHNVPKGELDELRLARCLGFSSNQQFEAHLAEVRVRVQACVASLRIGHHQKGRWTMLLAAIQAGNVEEVQAHLRHDLGEMATEQLGADLIELGALPDGLLGAMTAEVNWQHVDALLDALIHCADPEQAAKCLGVWSGHRTFKTVHASVLRAPPAVLRRFVTALGGSAFVGDLVVGHPEIVHHVLFSRGMPSAEAAARAVDREVDLLGQADSKDMELVSGAIRRAKLRVILEIVLADMAEEVGVVEVTDVLSALADACLQRALRAATGEDVVGISVLSVGKLGGRELGYGSDLDVIFVFEPKPGEQEGEAMALRARQAQRTIRILSEVHAEGPGYQLDTRLRPSGTQGVLVTSLRSFARYHGLGGKNEVAVRAAPWERQTLLRARFSAGDKDLGHNAILLAQRAAYEVGEVDTSEIHRLRMRMERELGGERPGRYDLKLGRGGLVDIEFAVQALQLQNACLPGVRTTNTLQAIDALESASALSQADATQLRNSYHFLRKLEQRLHVVHDTSIHLLEASAPGLILLARRMGLTSSPGRGAVDLLMDRYRTTTEATRATYEGIMGVPSSLRNVGMKEPAKK